MRYYVLRGLSLLFLPITLINGEAQGLGFFAIFYGLDRVATVPPTVRLTSESFGRENTGVVCSRPEAGPRASGFTLGRRTLSFPCGP